MVGGRLLPLASWEKALRTDSLGGRDGGGWGEGVERREDGAGKAGVERGG